MANAKIEVKIGPLSFAGEAEEKWLATQLDKLLQQAPALLSSAPDPKNDGDDDAGLPPKNKPPKGDPGTLAKFIDSKNAGSNQVKRFLATAEWLHRKGKERLRSGDVGKALTDNHQKRLANPADCLNQNVSKGHCEKVAKEFYVTPDGRATLA